MDTQVIPPYAIVNLLVDIGFDVNDAHPIPTPGHAFVIFTLLLEVITPP